MSQKYTPNSNRRFERLEKNRKYGETRQKYEQRAGVVLLSMLAGWSATLVALAVVLPRFTLVYLVAWIAGLSVGLMAFLRIHRAKRQSTMYLSTAKSLQEMYTMNSLDFEHAVALRMQSLDFTHVRVTPSRADGGIDILMERKGRKYGVQCKKYHPDSFVKIDELRAFVYAYRKAGCDCGVFVTTAKFSDYARREMEEEGVTLIDGQELVILKELH